MAELDTSSSSTMGDEDQHHSLRQATIDDVSSEDQTNPPNSLTAKTTSSELIMASRGVESYDSIVIRPDQGCNDPNNTAIIRVKEQQFNVPVTVLCKQSCFFRTKIHNNWRKDEEPNISLDGQDFAAVHLFTNWLKGDSAFNTGAMADLEVHSYKLLFDAFILGGNIQALPFQNVMLDAIAAKLMAGHPLDVDLPQITYQNTPKGSPLRRMLLDAYVREATAQVILAPGAQPYLDHEFLIDLTAALLCVRDVRTNDRPRPFAQSGRFCSRYHNHEMEGGAPCGGPVFTVAEPQATHGEALPIEESDEQGRDDQCDATPETGIGQIPLSSDNRPTGQATNISSDHGSEQDVNDHTAGFGHNILTPKTPARSSIAHPSTYATPPSTGKKTPRNIGTSRKLFHTKVFGDIASRDRATAPKIKADPDTPCPKRRKCYDDNAGRSAAAPICLD